MKTICLNPCYNGITLESQKNEDYAVYHRRLNPCYNGITLESLLFINNFKEIFFLDFYKPSCPLTT